MQGEIDPEKEGDALRAWGELSRGGREEWFKIFLPYLGISRASWYRRLQYLERSRPRKARADQGQRKIPQVEEWVRRIVRQKYAPEEGWRVLTTEDAVKQCLQNGMIPPEAAALPLCTINRIARELGLYRQPERQNRFQASFPGELHQFDASGSEHFYPVRQEGGSWILKLRRRRQKNRDKLERLRVWIYGLVDDYSRVHLARYVVAAGESAADGIDFLRWAWGKNEEHTPIYGIPETLYLDQGSMAKSKSFKDFCGAIPVNLKAHLPYKARATGKVEVRWRHLWRRFETIFGASQDWQKREISLDELNRQLYAFIARTNQGKHPNLDMSKLEAWLTGVKTQGGVVEIEPSAFMGAGKRYRRVLDGAGCFNFKGVAYHVEGLHSAPVWVYQLLLGGELLVKDPESGKVLEYHLFSPRLLGEYQGTQKTPLEEILSDAAYELPQASRFDFGAELPENVVYLTPRNRELRGGPEPEAQQGESAVEAREGEPVPRLFVSTLDRYEHLLMQIEQGRELSEDDQNFIAWFRSEYQGMLDLVGEAITRRIKMQLTLMNRE